MKNGWFMALLYPHYTSSSLIHHTVSTTAAAWNGTRSAIANSPGRTGSAERAACPASPRQSSPSVSGRHAHNGDMTHMLHIMGNNGDIMVYLPTKLDDFVRANVGKYSIHGVDMGWVVVDMICKKICNTWDLDRNQSHQGWDKHQHGEFKQHISDILRMSHVI